MAKNNYIKRAHIKEAKSRESFFCILSRKTNSGIMKKTEICTKKLLGMFKENPL